MADVKKTVEIIFGGKNELSATIGAIERDMSTLSGTIQDVSAPFAKLSSAIFTVDAALTAFVVGAMYKAISASSEFNEGFGLINTAIKANAEETNAYRESILNYALTSTKNIADINAAIYTAVQAGVNFKDSIAFMTASEQLATANAASLNTTVDLLTSTMNSYGMTMKDINHINDVYFTSTLIGKQTIDELGTSMGQVVGIAASSGVSLEELSAAIATLTAKGMMTDVAITGLKNVITSIVNPSNEVSKAAKEMGLNFDISTIKSKGFANTLLEIMEATGGSEEKIVSLFGEVRSMNAVMQLTNDNLKFFNYALNETANSAGSAEAAYRKMTETFSNKMQTIRNIIEVAFINIGTRLEPVFIGIASQVGDIFAALSNAVRSGAFDPLFRYLEEAGKEAAAKLAVIAKNLPEAMRGLDFTPIIEALKRLSVTFGKAFEDLFGKIDLSTPEGLRKVLQGIVDTIAKLIDLTKSIVDGMRPFIKILGEIAEKATNADEGFLNWVGTITGFMTVMNRVNPVLETTAFTIAAIANAPAAWSSIVALGSKLSGVGQVLGSILSMATLALTNPVVLAMLGISYGTYKAIDTGLEQYKATVDATILAQDKQSQAFAAQTAAMIVQKYEAGQLSASQAELKLRNLELASGLDLASVKAGIMAKETERVSNASKMAIESTNNLTKSLIAVPEKKTVTIGVQPDGSTIERVEGLIVQKFPDGRPMVITNIGVEANKASIDKTKKDIEKEIPREKLMEIQANIDIARIKEQSEIIKSSIEWKAKVDIADIESKTERIKAVFASINTAIESTGTTLASMFSGYVSYLSSGHYSSALEGAFSDENRRRNEAFELQKRLTEMEIQEIEARTRLMREGGDVAIKISAEGLKPHLEAFMWEILNEIQVRATAEGVKMLVA